MMTPAAAPTARRPRRLDPVWVRALVLVLAGLFVYAPVIGGGWLIDDNIEVVDNLTLQGPGALGKIWAGAGSADYLPLKSTVQWALWHLFGSDPLPFHLVNIALHLLSACLLWRLFWRLGMPHAWIGGLLFAVHPLLVESVAWPAELKNTLSLALLLPAILAWLRFDDSRRWPHYLWSLGLYAAALLCKSSVIGWPVVMLLHAWWRRGRIAWQDAVSSVPFFLLAGADAALTVAMQSARAIRSEVYPLGGLASHVALAGMDAAFYLWKVFLPFGLLPMYPRWRIDPPTALEFVPALLLIALVGWLWTRRRTSWGRAACLGVGFYLFNVLPVLGFFRMSFMRIAWVSDHLAYLPSIGIIGLVAAGAGALYDRLRGEIWQTRAQAAGWICLGGLVIISRVQAGVYFDLETMSRYTVAQNPGAWMAHQIYSKEALHHGDFDTALAEGREAVRLRPEVAETHSALGAALGAKGRLSEAIAEVEKARTYSPTSWKLREQLAFLLTAAHRPREATEIFGPLLRHAPSNALYHSYDGACLLEMGRLDEAIEQFREALALQPDLPATRANLATATQQRAAQARSGPTPPATP